MRFHYLAYTLKGGVVKDRIEARNEAEARTEIARQGYKLLHIKPTKSLPSLEVLFPSIFRVSARDIVQFCRQMATMVSSGGNLLRILEMLHSESHSRMMRRTLMAIRKTLDEGGSLSSSLAQHPQVFSPLFVSVVEAGEYTGKTGPALEQIADILEREHEAKQKAMRTLMYPLVIMGLSMSTLGVLMTVALPPLLTVFEQMGSQMPMMTRLAVNAFSGLKTNYVPILLGVIGLIVLFSLLRRIPRARHWLDLAQSRAPVLGSFIVAGELARFSRTMSMLLEAGVSLATALRLGTNSCKNMVLRRAFADAEESLMDGHGLTKALKRHPILPTLFVELVMIGEESNSLRQTMRDAASAYEKLVEQRLNNLLGMLEPISTVAVGGIVGFIAFSMFVPIYSGLNAVR